MHLSQTRHVPELGGKIAALLDLFLVVANVLTAGRDAHQTKAQAVGAIFINQLERIGRVAQRLRHLWPSLSRIRPVKYTWRNGMLSSSRSDLPGLNSSPAMIMRATQKKMMSGAVTRTLVG